MEERRHEYKPDGLFLTPPSGSPLITRYHWFGDGLNLLELNNDSVDPATSQTFTYDDAGRMLSGAGPFGSRTWTYDKVGNRTSEAKDPLGLSLSPSPAEPTTIDRQAQGPGFGFSGLGVVNPPGNVAIDPKTYPSDLLGLSSLQQDGLGLAKTYAQPNATTVPRDGPSLFGYARQSPLMETDKTGLANFTPGPNPSVQNCALLPNWLACHEKCLAKTEGTWPDDQRPGLYRRCMRECLGPGVSY